MYKGNMIWCRILGEGIGCLIKDDMPGYDDPVGGPVKTAVSFVMRGIAKKDTQGGAGGEFVGSGG